jgi:hypothetical protein
MWIKTSDHVPPDDEPVLIHDARNNRIEVGRRVKGRWYVEDPPGGRLREIAGVTHWSLILDYMVNDDGDDD